MKIAILGAGALGRSIGGVLTGDFTLAHAND